MPEAKPAKLAQLYETDYLRWLDETIERLRQGALNELDRSNLVEELADMGRSERRAGESHLAVAIEHLLKYRYQPEGRSPSWERSIRHSRRQLRRLLRDSPSLRGHLQQQFEECYQDARYDAIQETGLPAARLPTESPFTLEQILDEAFWPES